MMVRKNQGNKDGVLIVVDSSDGMRFMQKMGFVHAMLFTYEHTIIMYLATKDRHNVARKNLEKETGRCISWAFVMRDKKKVTPTTAMVLMIKDIAQNT